MTPPSGTSRRTTVPKAPADPSVPVRKAPRKSTKPTGSPRGPAVPKHAHPKMVEYIVSGCTNDQINNLFVEAKIIRAPLTRRAFDYWRAKPECKVDIAMLTEEARVAGMAALSEQIVGWINIGKVAQRKLLGTSGFAIEPKDVKEVTALLNAIKMSSDVLFPIFGPNLSEVLRDFYEKQQGPDMETAKDIARAEALEMFGDMLIKQILKARQAEEATPRKVAEAELDRDAPKAAVDAG